MLLLIIIIIIVVVLTNRSTKRRRKLNLLLHKMTFADIREFKYPRVYDLQERINFSSLQENDRIELPSYALEARDLIIKRIFKQEGGPNLGFYFSDGNKVHLVALVAVAKNKIAFHEPHRRMANITTLEKTITDYFNRQRA